MAESTGDKATNTAAINISRTWPGFGKIDNIVILCGFQAFLEGISVAHAGLFDLVGIHILPKVSDLFSWLLILLLPPAYYDHLTAHYNPLDETWTESPDAPNWIGWLLSKYRRNPNLISYNYAVGGAEISGVHGQIHDAFLPAVGQKPDWAFWDELNTLFGASRYLCSVGVC